MAEQINHPAIGVQIDTKALAENAEIAPRVFDMASSRLVHVHVNEPRLGIVGETGTVDHSAIGAELRRDRLSGICFSGAAVVERR